MKYCSALMAGLIALILYTAAPSRAAAGSVEEIKKGTRDAVSEIGKVAVRAGKAAAKTGKEIKKGAAKTGTSIKQSAKEVGRGFKKAYRETRDAVTREFSGDTREPSDK